MKCPNCGKKNEPKQIGDIPYARPIYARYLLNCDVCMGMFDIFITGKPKETKK